jgi:hypothetical protein
MRVQSDPSVLIDRTLTAFHLAAGDTLEEAKRIAAPSSRTGRYERSLQLGETSVSPDRIEVSLGSPLRSATAKERGAYIQAKKADWLAIPMPDGTMRKVKAVRLPARPVVGRAGPRFVDFMTARLKAQR